MTVCKCLAEKEIDGIVVSAMELLDKYDRAPHYEIYISKNGIAYQTVKTARTTWKKKFDQIVGEV